MAMEGVSMHPLFERKCDHLLEHALLRSPPPEPEKPRPPRVRKRREFKIPERFPLLDIEFYKKWVNHYKELQVIQHKVDTSPPELFPELYLKPRRLDYYALQLEANMKVNKELLKKINLVQRTGGCVDSWLPPYKSNYNKRLCDQRQRELNAIRRKNLYFYGRLLIARSKQPLTKELNEMWKDTREKLILGSAQPFILFKEGKIDKDMVDPEMERPPNVIRPKVMMDIRVLNGAKIGKITIELFMDLVPTTCALFLNLVKGDSNGYAYKGTRIFKVVPGLFCSGGDVCKDNGFGCYIPEGETEHAAPENLLLSHTIPGVLSMMITKDCELCGIFNIIFKPLPQFDGKHVVFGRIIAGPAQTLERISFLGLPRGGTTSDIMIHDCGYMTHAGRYKEGAANTIKFPPRKNKKKS